MIEKLISHLKPLRPEGGGSNIFKCKKHLSVVDPSHWVKPSLRGIKEMYAFSYDLKWEKEVLQMERKGYKGRILEHQEGKIKQ